MALKVTKEADPIEVTRMTVTLYAAPGLGKTSTAFTADKPLLLDFDHGAYRSAFRKDTVQVERWADVTDISADDVAAYNTIVVDTVGRALDALTTHLIAENPKFKGYGGALSLQGYGALKSTFGTWLKQLSGFGKDIVLLAHMDEQRNGDDVTERLDIQGATKNEVHKQSDAMGRIFVENRQRVLTFDPDAGGFGKNPAGLDPIHVPHFASSPMFLADLIKQMKATLNSKTEGQRKAMQELADWSAKFDDAETVEDFNALRDECSDCGDNVKRLLMAKAKAKGVSFDRDAGEFKAAA